MGSSCNQIEVRYEFATNEWWYRDVIRVVIGFRRQGGAGNSGDSIEGSSSGGCCEYIPILDAYSLSGTSSLVKKLAGPPTSAPLAGSCRERWEKGSGLGENMGVSQLGSKEAYPITYLLSSTPHRSSSVSSRSAIIL